MNNRKRLIGIHPLFRDLKGILKSEQQNYNKDDRINGEVFDKEQADDKEYVKENFDFRDQQVTLIRKKQFIEKTGGDMGSKSLMAAPIPHTQGFDVHISKLRVFKCIFQFNPD